MGAGAGGMPTGAIGVIGATGGVNGIGADGGAGVGSTCEIVCGCCAIGAGVIGAAGEIDCGDCGGGAIGADGEIDCGGGATGAGGVVSDCGAGEPTPKNKSGMFSTLAIFCGGFAAAPPWCAKNSGAMT
jgi:hypothetical protein